MNAKEESDIVMLVINHFNNDIEPKQRQFTQ